MKKTILAVALSISAFSTFAQSNENIFVQHKWIDLQTNLTDLAQVQAACQAHGTNYHVPTSAQLSTFRTEYRDRTQRRALRSFLVNALSGEKERNRLTVTTPKFLVDFGGEASQASIEATGIRGTVKYQPLLGDGSTENSNNSDDLFTSLLASFVSSEQSNQPILNVCVQVGEVQEVVDEYAGLKRHEFTLPSLENESEKLIDFVINKQVTETCNSTALDGTIIKKPANGIESTHYVLPSYGITQTLKACTSISENKELLRVENSNVFSYDSSEPLVIYAPEDLEVKYSVKNIVR
ncbi:ecotin [Vibrio nigripulchritudo ATCC 27043]|uniref:ecotin n=1 Tax=Vibrio nigripulchritudo TaxID=28173 RepID=UPI00021C1B3C|nr:ecotin [Vibrio nigripulchritudo]EGU61712.1 ecotin [Vibrio nigripulchritudo ATCC 27043]